ncbi:MAG: hypothetical protein WBE38_14070, partial [Terracidiphilus sp.]
HRPTQLDSHTPRPAKHRLTGSSAASASLLLLHNSSSNVLSICNPQGLRKRRSAFSSASLRFARTRMCIAIVPEIRGENPSGELWHREQFCSKTCCPRSGLAVFAIFCAGACCFGFDSWFICPQNGNAQASIAPNITVIRNFIAALSCN